MLTKIKSSILLLFAAWLLNSCITPLEGDGTTDGVLIKPLDLHIGQSWVFQINDSKTTYQDSFFVKDTKLINFDNLTVSPYLVAFPALQHKNTDTIFYKYWKLENNQLIEYGWEKRSRNNYNNEYAAQIYPRKIVVADFGSTAAVTLFNNDTLRINQSGKASITEGDITKEAIGVDYRSFYGWYGFPECDYITYFCDNQPFKIDGYIRGIHFTGTAKFPQTKKDNNPEFSKKVNY